MLAGSTPPFLGRERAAVDVDVGPERRSPRYHETCLALESVKESSAAVSTCKPRASARGVWLRMPIVKNLEEARRLPVRVEEQQAQQLAMNPPRSAADGDGFWGRRLFSTAAVILRRLFSAPVQSLKLILRLFSAFESCRAWRAA